MLVENCTLPDGAEWGTHVDERDGKSAVQIIIFRGGEVEDIYELARTPIYPPSFPARS